MYPEKLTEFIKTADSQKLGLLCKTLMNPEKFKKSIPLFKEVIDEYNTIDKTPFGNIDVGIILQWIKQDIFTIPVCKTCGTPLKWISSLTRYNQNYCNAKCYGGDATFDRGKKIIDIDKAKHLYINEKKSILEISEILGDISNVSLKKRLSEV
jgi:hypothetical protein